MPNITFSFDESIIREAKILAAQAETSVNAILRDYLSHLSSLEIYKQDAMNGNLQILFNYSIGKLNRKQACKKLGVEDLVLSKMLGEAGFPPPRANIEQEDAMLEEIKDIRL